MCYIDQYHQQRLEELEWEYIQEIIQYGEWYNNNLNTINMENLTERDQDLILEKALKKLNLDSNNTFFIAVINAEHPDNAIEVIHKNKAYYVTIQHSDFVCIYPN